MPSTDPKIRNRVQNWYIVVQARRLVDAGYTKTATAERLGVSRRSMTRWSQDEELWAAAAVAPDREAVGPAKGRPWRPLQVLADAVDAAERPADGQQKPPGTSGPGNASPSETSPPTTTPGHHPEQNAHARENATPDATPRHDATAQTDTEPTGRERAQNASNADDSRHGTRQDATEPARGTNPPNAPQVPAQREDGADRRRYDGLAGTAIGKALARHRVDPSPLDTTPELDLLRATAEDYVLRRSETPCPACRRGMPPDPDVVARLADKISTAADRLVKARQSDAIPRGEFIRFMGELGRSIRRHCDRLTAEAISEDVLSFRP